MCGLKWPLKALSERQNQDGRTTTAKIRIELSREFYLCEPLI